MPENRLLVVGDDASQDGPRRVGSGPNPWLGALGILAVVVAVLALLRPVTPASDATDLALPPEPPAVPTTPPPTTIPDVATGWRRLDLPGGGTVVGLTHGGAGWMAVAEGDTATVSISSDARVWLSRDFPGTFHGRVRTLVTDDTFVVVDSAVAGRTRSWISTDRGETWDTTLFAEAPARVDTVTKVGSRLLAGGSVSTDGAEPWMPAVWEYRSGTWTRLAFPDPPQNYGAVAVIAGDAGIVLAFGSADGTPASWRLGGDTAETNPMAVPFPAEAITDVVRSAQGWWLGEFETGSTVSYATSDDLSGWEPLAAGLPSGRSSSVTVTDGGIVLVGDDDQAYRIARETDVTEVRYRYPGVVTGFESDRHSEVVASDGDRIVIGGGSGTSALWVRGADGGLVGVTAPPDDTGRWTTIQKFGYGYWGADPRPLQAAVGDAFYLATPQGVWRTADPVAEMPVAEGRQGASLHAAAGDLYLVDSGMRLIRRQDGNWITEDVGFSVAGVTDGPSGVMAFGWDTNGAVAVRSTDGTWRRLDTPTQILPFVGHGGEILGLAREDAGVWRTVDGTDWTPIEAVGIGGRVGGVPFLVTSTGDQGSTIRLLGESTELVVPSIDPVEAIRVGSTVRIRGADGLWESTDDGATWTSYPIGIQYRLRGAIRLVPTERLVLLEAARDSYHLLTFEP